jgi:UDPglucose 6-dehydrogenase
MRIAVIGTGYVGLVTGTCLAEMGHHVTCLDIDAQKIEGLRAGKMPIFEPGLKERVRRNASEQRLEFTCDYDEAIPRKEAIFLALPTPPGNDGGADLSFLERAVRQVARHLTGYTIVINKSTAPLGTCERIEGWLNEEMSRRLQPVSFSVACNPEFLKQGNAVNDFLKPDRVIIGADDASVGDVLRRLYLPFSLNHDRIMVMDRRSAEMAKYAANAMLATRISLMNELASLCEKTGADISQVRLGLGADSRIGYHFLYAGAGFGGSCFPKDLLALQAMGVDHEVPLPLLEAVYQVNERQKHLIARKIKAYFQELKGRTLGILGLAFKPETDDVRCAPSLVVIQDLLQAGCRVRLYDPVAMPNAARHLPPTSQIEWCENEEECARGADGLVLMTEWKQFRLLDFQHLLANMCGKVLFDGRNQYASAEMAAIGFDYIGIGKQPHQALGQVAAAEQVEEESEAAAGLPS